MHPAETSNGVEGHGNPYTAPGTEIGEGTSAVTAVGKIPWPVFLRLGLITGVLFGVLWSFFMSLAMGQSFVSILAGAGAGGGLFFGIFFGVFMAVLMRPATVTFPIGDREAFLSRLDGEMEKLRYRHLGESSGERTYGPRTLYRPDAFNMAVRIGNGEATAVGPKANVKALKTRFEKA